MKLIIKNFTGTFENGNRYRIKISNRYVKSMNQIFMFIYVEELKLGWDIFADAVWLYNEDYKVSGFYNKGCYAECLKNCLLELEKKINVKLIKAVAQCDILGGVDAKEGCLLKN